MAREASDERERSRLIASLPPLLWAVVPWILARNEALVDRAPVLGVLDGPLGFVLLVCGGSLSLYRLWPMRPELRGPPPWLLFLVGAGVFLVMGIHYTNELRVSGDEPHYLLMAQSLWRERDLDLRDNLEREDYREYTPGPLAPHYGSPRRDGRPYPAHSPGLPILLAPIYALGGRRACVVLLSLMGAVLGLEVRRLALRLVGDRPEAVLLAWATALGPPAAYYCFHVYTELPSALALAFSVRVILSVPTPASALAAGLAASTLPWLHVKMIPVVVGLGALAAWRLKGSSRVIFLPTAGLMAAGYLAYQQYVFGRPSPLAVYGGVPPQLAGTTIVRAFLGLLLDRSFGLLPYAPVFALALSGFGRSVEARQRDAWILLALSGLVLLPVLPWRMWWGGQCPPGRFLVPLAPFLALLLAMRATRGPARGLFRWRWALAAWGWALTIFMAAQPGALLFVNRGDRPTRVWNALSGSVPIQRYLPSVVSGDGVERRVATLWLGAVVLLLLLDLLARRWDGANRLFGSLGLPVCLFLLVGTLVDRWARAHVDAPGAPTGSQSGSLVGGSFRGGG